MVTMRRCTCDFKLRDQFAASAKQPTIAKCWIHINFKSYKFYVKMSFLNLEFYSMEKECGGEMMISMGTLLFEWY